MKKIKSFVERKLEKFELGIIKYCDWFNTDRKTRNYIKSFIKSALTQQKKEILKEVRLEIACYSAISAKATKDLIKLIKNL